MSAVKACVDINRGAAELQEKLPVHLDTTTRCYPQYVVYSDFEETFQDQKILDTLQYVSQHLRDEHTDFELYRQLQQHGRSFFTDVGSDEEEDRANWLNVKNTGWKLDKWKFLPMVNQTLYDFPDVKWYIFSDCKTSVPVT
jgi:hypothetical protein